MSLRYRSFAVTSLQLGRCLFLATILVATPHIATGQGMPGGMGGGMGRGGGRRHGGHTGQSGQDADRHRAMADSIMEQRGFAAFVLDHAQALTLTPDQRLSLDSISTAFHTSADTLRPQLDSLRAQNTRALSALFAPGVSHTAGDSLSTIQRDSLIQRRKAISAVLLALRTLEQDTRTRTLATLTPEQRTQVTTFERMQHEAGGSSNDTVGGTRHRQ